MKNKAVGIRGGRRGGQRETGFSVALPPVREGEFIPELRAEGGVWTCDNLGKMSNGDGSCDLCLRLWTLKTTFATVFLFDYSFCVDFEVLFFCSYMKKWENGSVFFIPSCKRNYDEEKVVLLSRMFREIVTHRQKIWRSQGYKMYTHAVNYIWKRSIYISIIKISALFSKIQKKAIVFSWKKEKNCGNEHEVCVCVEYVSACPAFGHRHARRPSLGFHCALGESSAIVVDLGEAAVEPPQSRYGTRGL